MAKKDKLQQLREEQERLLIKIRQAVEDNYSSMLNIPGVKQAVSDNKSDFFFSQNGAVNKAIGRIIDRMAKRIDGALLNGVEKHWEQGTNNLWVNLEVENVKATNERKAFEKIRERATQSVRNSAKSFYNEKRGGLSVSDRVWNLAGNSKKEMEIIIQKGIKEGKTVDEIQKGLKQYLNEPDMLFRRVVNKETGELELSKAAKLYKPGRGVYRSAYKNAMRLARTEMNAAYRQAEWESYQSNPLITGYKIMLSNNHTTLINGVPTPFHCICDDLQGVYPKTFKWLGWHPQCRCTMSPILITQPERKDLYKSIFGGNRKNWEPKQITEYPKAFTDWIEKNKGRQNDWSSTPYFIRDNFKDGLLVNGLNHTTNSDNEVVNKVSTLNLKDLIKGDEPTNKEIKEIFMRYAQANPEDFRGGLGDIKFRKSRSYMMQHGMKYNTFTREWVGNSTITISTNTFGNFNPAEELRKALAAVKNGQKLTFNQEYSIESLWHEILHATTKTVPQQLTSDQLRSMETVNQFTARHTYDTLLERLGGSASNKADILDRGYGYSSWIKDFREKLKRYDIPEQVALDELRPVLMSDYKKVDLEVLKFFNRHKKN